MTPYMTDYERHVFASAIFVASSHRTRMKITADWHAQSAIRPRTHKYWCTPGRLDIASVDSSMKNIGRSWYEPVYHPKRLRRCERCTKACAGMRTHSRLTNIKTFTTTMSLSLKPALYVSCILPGTRPAHARLCVRRTVR